MPVLPSVHEDALVLVAQVILLILQLVQQLGKGHTALLNGLLHNETIGWSSCGSMTQCSNLCFVWAQVQTQGLHTHVDLWGDCKLTGFAHMVTGGIAGTCSGFVC